MASEIDLLILDFDGVLTDNRVYVSESGEESVACHRGDSWGINLLKESGLQIMILSTETNPVVSVRAKKLGVDCKQGCGDKKKALEQILANTGVDASRVMYVGNDTNDAAAMALVGYPVAPADANPKILQCARLVTESKGGYGVVRELAEILLDDSEGVRF